MVCRVTERGWHPNGPRSHKVYLVVVQGWGSATDELPAVQHHLLRSHPTTRTWNSRLTHSSAAPACFKWVYELQEQISLFTFPCLPALSTGNSSVFPGTLKGSLGVEPYQQMCFIACLSVPFFSVQTPWRIDDLRKLNEEKRKTPKQNRNSKVKMSAVSTPPPPAHSAEQQGSETQVSVGKLQLLEAINEIYCLISLPRYHFENILKITKMTVTWNWNEK